MITFQQCHQKIHERLDLALGFARLARYYQEVGTLSKCAEQRELAMEEYRAILEDWDESALDALTATLLGEKRSTVERCLAQLEQNDSCLRRTCLKIAPAVPFDPASEDLQPANLRDAPPVEGPREMPRLVCSPRTPKAGLST